MHTPLFLKRLLVMAAFSCLGFINSGCENKSETNLASAQSCLDAASTTDEANACALQVQNDHSAQAYLIRCSANFIAQGITGDRLALAYKQMDSSTATNKTTALMAYMIFNNTLAGNSSSETTLNCQLSGVSSMYQLASAASLATTVSNLAASLSGLGIAALLPDANGNIDPTQLQNAINSFNPLTMSTADQSTIGNAVLNANDALCSAGSSFSSQDVCARIGNAVTTNPNDPAAVGAALLALLAPGSATP